MAFDWLHFLESHHIEYVTSGPNVSRGNVAVHCPFCGGQDPSQHMGISLDNKGWSCWRKSDHRGKNPVRLVQALLRCSLDEARRITGTSTFIPEDFLSRVKLEVEGIPVTPSGILKLLPEFLPFTGLPSSKFHVHYLLSRGFTQSHVNALTDDYGIRYCNRGPFRGRIIFPIYFEGKLVTWTGRSIYKQERLRYKTLHTHVEKAKKANEPLALMAPADCLLWYDDLMQSDAETIFVVEGPFDALKISCLGRDAGIAATCLFTNHASRAQLDLLYTLLPRFRRRYVMLDADAFVNALEVSNHLSSLDVPALPLPSGLNDPGEITKRQLLAIAA